MKRSTENLISLIKEFTPIEDNELDNDNVEFFNNLIEELQNHSNAYKAISPFFELLEKYPRIDFGNPGPIIHFIEKFIGIYEISLYE